MNERIVDVPFTPITPFFEPLVGPQWAEFAYPIKMRHWWKAVGEGKCQTHLYSERRGWYICGSQVDIEIDHIDPESVQLVEGRDPNNSVGIPRCHEHHTGMGLIREEDGSLRLANYGEVEWAKHPDMGLALIKYRKGDKDAFRDAARRHRELAKAGLPIANTTPEIDQFELEYMLNLERIYMEKTGLKRPCVKPHKKLL